MNRQQTIEAIKVMQAFVDGKTVECNPFSFGLAGWSELIDPGWNFDRFKYRIKPTAKLRPWTADDVPLGAWLRYKVNQQSLRLLIVSSLERGLAGYNTHWPYQALLQEMEHSTDGGKTWLPCGVMEEKQ